MKYIKMSGETRSTRRNYCVQKIKKLGFSWELKDSKMEVIIMNRECCFTGKVCFLPSEEPELYDWVINSDFIEHMKRDDDDMRMVSYE
tara:strand:- start:111 stop:374 length:264 start_codon:yes stop_codon:yes gene_type:complete